MGRATSQAGRHGNRAPLATLAVLVLVAVAFAGCTSSQAGTPPTTTTGTLPPTPPAPTSTGTGTGAPGATAAPPGLNATKKEPPAPPRLDLGAVAPGKPLQKTGECPCPPMQFTLDTTGSAGKTWLELRVTWDGTKTAGLLPRVVPPGGNTSFPATRGFDDRRIQAFGATAGTYALDLEGKGSYAMDISFQTFGARRGAGTTLLPNLVTLVPIEVALGPCDQIEAAEQGAKKCLRLANGIGNTGDGPAEVHLTFDRAALAFTPLEGDFFQRVFNADGTFTDHDVGPADFHLAHRHWHYANLANFKLHSYDPATGLRGPEVASHHKQGFCFLDWGEMNATDVDPSGGSNAEQNCLYPLIPDGWSMGISRGYYDYYEAKLTDQYVDVAGVPDGTYELVSTADETGSLDELDRTDNSASVVLRLEGDQVTLLEERGHYIPREYRWSHHPAP